MLPVKTNIEAFQKLHLQWLNSLEACAEQLHSLDSITRQLLRSNEEDTDEKALAELRNNVLLQAGVIKEMTEEVMRLNKKFCETKSDNTITMGDLMDNNRLRDKIRKLEQHIFTLKNRVNQILSLSPL